MAGMYTTGSWKPFPGQEEAFVAAWTEFANWASELPGAGTAILTHDLRAPERFRASWTGRAWSRSAAGKTPRSSRSG